MKKIIRLTISTTLTLTAFSVLALPAPKYTEDQLLQVAQKSSEALYLAATADVQGMTFYEGQSQMTMNKGPRISNDMLGFRIDNNIYLSSINNNFIAVRDLGSHIGVNFGLDSLNSNVGNRDYGTGHIKSSVNFESIKIDNFGGYDEAGNEGNLSAQVSKKSNMTTIEILNSMRYAVDKYTFMPMLFASEFAGPFLGQQLSSYDHILVKDVPDKNAIEFSKIDTRSSLGLSCRGVNKRYYWAVRYDSKFLVDKTDIAKFKVSVANPKIGCRSVYGAWVDGDQ